MRKYQLLLFLSTIGLIMLFTVMSVLAQSIPPCKWGCEDKSNCGQCEVINDPYEGPICGQLNCQRVGSVVVNYFTCNIGNIYRTQRLRKSWWDCNSDRQADCECWTWEIL